MTRWILFKVWLMYQLPHFFKQAITTEHFWFGYVLGLITLGFIGVIL